MAQPKRIASGVIEVEHHYATYGDEVTFGGGKVIRDGMGQSSTATREGLHGALDLVITNALIIDHWGIVKGDIGIRDGRIVKVGKAGNPDTMAGVDPDLVIGSATEVIAGENLIVTAGALDTHIHFISPQQIFEAISNGITTMIGGGTGPATGTNATTCSPGSWNIQRMLEAAEAWPMNFGFLGKGNTATPLPLAEQIEGGACGLKLHEDWGTTPAAIDTTCRSPFIPTLSTRPASSRTPSVPSATAPSTRITPKAPEAAMLRTLSGLPGSPTSCHPLQIPRGRSPSIPLTSISTC